MNPRADHLGGAGEPEIGADGGRGAVPKTRIMIGAISEPPPTPVRPTNAPTPKPAATLIQLMDVPSDYGKGALSANGAALDSRPSARASCARETFQPSSASTRN